MDVDACPVERHRWSGEGAVLVRRVLELLA